MRVLADGERLNRVTRLATLCQLAIVRIGVTRRALCPDPCQASRGGLTRGELSYLDFVARLTHEGSVLPVEGKCRPGVIEGRDRELRRLQTVARFALQADLPRMDVAVARHARGRCRFQADMRHPGRTRARGAHRCPSDTCQHEGLGHPARRYVALFAPKRSMLTVEERSLPGVNERCPLERSCRVTGFAVGPEVPVVHVGVTRHALGPQPAEVGCSDGRGCDTRRLWRRSSTQGLRAPSRHRGRPGGRDRGRGNGRRGLRAAASAHGAAPKPGRWRGSPWA